MHMHNNIKYLVYSTDIVSSVEDYVISSTGLTKTRHPDMLGRYSIIALNKNQRIYKQDNSTFYLIYMDNAWLVGDEAGTILRRPMSSWNQTVPDEGWSYRVGNVWTFDHSVKVDAIKSKSGVHVSIHWKMFTCILLRL